MARSRRGGGGGGGLFGSRKKAAPARHSAPPARAAPAPPAPQQSSGGGMMSGIGSTIAQGMAFGTGSAIAHRAVGAVAGSMSGSGGDAELPQETAVAQQYDGAQQQQMQVCGSEKQMFFDCLKENKGDQEVCRFLYETLQSCQQTGPSVQYS